jgi:hypothetical protein
MTEPASIRFNNPGAMWGGSRANKWGATADIVLHDGESNHMAVFPTKVQGAAAQFDLWKSNYTGISLATAVTKWCGGNSPSAYVKFLCERTGIHPLDQVTPYLLSGPQGLALVKAQAAWESGRIKDGYPMTDAEWQTAQSMVFHGAVPPPPDIPKPKPEPLPHPGLGAFILSIIRAIFSLFGRK